MNKNRSRTYTPQEILDTIAAAFNETTEGEYALLSPKGKPDPALHNLYMNPAETPNLIHNPHTRDGFAVEIQSKKHGTAILEYPEELHDILTLTKNPGYHITKIYRKTGHPTAATQDKLTIIKIEDGFPTTQEIEKAFKKTNTQPTYIKIQNNTIKKTQPTPQKNTQQQKKQNTTQTIKKLAIKFHK